MGRLSILIWLSLGLIWTCANERAITGGPKDKEAPQIILSMPQNESVNVDPNTEVLIKFNEQMKQATFTGAVQIWPQPPSGYELKSSWTWLKLKFNEPLEQNETYLITIDKTAQDLQGNGLASTYIQAFSTGEDLNSGRLRGTIYGGKDLRKMGNLFLYRQFDASIAELRAKPADYIFQPDDQGIFELSYLAEQSYMLFYHWDRNQNKLIDGDDYFGRPEQPLALASDDSISTNYHLWPQLIPLNNIKLLGLTELEENFIQIRVNRPVKQADLSKIKLIADEVEIPILGTATVAEDEYAMHFNIAKPLKDSALVWIQNFQDTSRYSLSSDTLQFRSAIEFDSLALNPLKVSWLNHTNKRFPNEASSILIESNLPFEFKSDSAFHVVDSQVDSIKIFGTLDSLTSMTIQFLPDTVLEDGRNYRWQIETQYIDAPLRSNMLDSLMAGSLVTVTEDSLGSLRIMQMGVEVLECRLRSKGTNRTFKLRPGTAYLIDNLPAQQYSLSAYVDVDGNGHYDSGGFETEMGAEPFWFYSGEIKVRARWETDLGVWELVE